MILTEDVYCAPYLSHPLFPTAVTVLIAFTAYTFYSAGRSKSHKVIVKKSNSKSCQTEDDGKEAKLKKEILSLQRQLRTNNTVMKNLDEEHQFCGQQINNLKKSIAERREQISHLTENLVTSNKKIEELETYVQQLTLQLQTQQLKSNNLEKDASQNTQNKEEDEFQSAMSMLIEMAEKSVRQEILSNGNGIGDKTNTELSDTDWSFIMSVAGMRRDYDQELQVELKKSEENRKDENIGLSKNSNHIKQNDYKSHKPFENTSSLNEGNSRKPNKKNKDKKLSKRKDTPSNKFNEQFKVQFEAASVSTATSLCAALATIHYNNSSNCCSEDDQSANSKLSIHAQPFVPKSVQINKQLQERLQTWVQYYHSHIQPYEATPSLEISEIEEPSPDPPQDVTLSTIDTPKQESNENENVSIPLVHTTSEVASTPVVRTSSFVSRVLWEDSDDDFAWAELLDNKTLNKPQKRRISKIPIAPASHRSTPSSSMGVTPEQSFELESETISSHIDSNGHLCCNRVMDNVDIGFEISFPMYSLELEPSAQSWLVINRHLHPMKMLCYTPFHPEFQDIWKMIISEELLLSQVSLNSYIDICKQNLQQLLSPYSKITFEDDQPVLLHGGIPAVEVIYTQDHPNSDNISGIVWTLFTKMEERALSFQCVTLINAIPNIDSFIYRMSEVTRSLRLKVPKPNNMVMSRVQPTPSITTQATHTIQRAVRCWLARRLVSRLRALRDSYELEDDVNYDIEV